MYFHRGTFIRETREGGIVYNQQNKRDSNDVQDEKKRCYD